MEAVAFLLLLLPAAVWLSLPAMADLSAWVRSWFGRRPDASDVSEISREVPRLLFLVPAHDEEMLIDRCVRSLLRQEYPSDRISVVVVADNCSDRTAVVAQAAGAVVMQRHQPYPQGKQHAIAWALRHLSASDYAAIVIVDADTVVDPAFARELGRRSPLEETVLQGYYDLSNEFDSWLTRLSGVLTRNRYEVSLPLKAAARLNCPLTGNATVIGTRVLERHGWHVDTVTEGWELYAAYTVLGLTIQYEPRARIYAQEARSLRQSASQRQRWTAGRLAVLRKYWFAIVAGRGLRLLQRLDLLAELSAVGPVMTASLGLVGIAATAVLRPTSGPVLAVLFAAPCLQQTLYCVISLSKHPNPWRTLLAFSLLPLYAVWRVAIGLRSLFSSGKGRWIRTARHDERATGPAGRA